MVRPSNIERAHHIFNAINLIQEFIKGIDEQQFLNDPKIQSAVQYQFLLIGEAVGQMDSDFLAEYDYPWHIPKSFRNFIIHAYHGVKMERIYYAARDLSNLELVIKEMMKNVGET